MSATPDDSWGPIGGAVLRWLAYPPAPGASLPAAINLLIALGALTVALGTTVYMRLRAFGREQRLPIEEGMASSRWLATKIWHG